MSVSLAQVRSLANRFLLDVIGECVRHSNIVLSVVEWRHGSVPVPEVRCLYSQVRIPLAEMQGKPAAVANLLQAHVEVAEMELIDIFQRAMWEAPMEYGVTHLPSVATNEAQRPFDKHGNLVVATPAEYNAAWAAWRPDSMDEQIARRGFTNLHVPEEATIVAVDMYAQSAHLLDTNRIHVAYYGEPNGCAFDDWVKVTEDGEDFAATRLMWRGALVVEPDAVKKVQIP